MWLSPQSQYRWKKIDFRPPSSEEPFASGGVGAYFFKASTDDNVVQHGVTAVGVGRSGGGEADTDGEEETQDEVFAGSEGENGQLCRESWVENSETRRKYSATILSRDWSKEKSA